MSTPIPRTSSAIIASGFQAVPEGFRAFAGNLERELTALTTERNQLRAEAERLRAGIGECLRQNGHLADGDNCTLIGLKRCLRAIDAAMKEDAK